MANDYTSLNAQLNLIGTDGKIQFDKDREAARQYHLQNINQNTVFFHNLKEKLNYLVDNDYYERELLDQYGFDFVKSMFQRAYSYKYRFETFMGAYKFYTSYALRTNSGDRWLERFEDRVVMTSLLLGGGDEERVKKVLDSIISGRYQPATPTFLNAGRKQRGDYVSCFPADALVRTETGERRIDSISAGDKVYGHDGRLHKVENVVVNDNDSAAVAVSHSGTTEAIVLTGNHPVLVYRPNRKAPKIHIPGDGADEGSSLYWVSANMILPGDQIVQPAANIEEVYAVAAPVGLNDYILHDVTGVESAKIRGDKVYNLEVEGAHTYIVKNMIVHNCYLIRVEDNMESIARTATSVLQLSKRGGGVGVNLSNLRESGAAIKKIENQSSGVVPVMKILEDSFSYANQLGARPGAGVVYLNIHHPDIQAFLDTKKENADEKVRIKTLSLGVVVTDVVFHLAKEGRDMALFSPYDVEKAYGKPFSDVSITELYDEMVANEDIKKRWVSARDLLQQIAEIQFESGYPYLLFEDTANREHPVRNMGRINMSNLCVTGDTDILTDGGYRKVIDLFESQENFDVVVDKRARDMNLESTGVSVEKSTKMFKTAEAAEIFKLTTVEGHSIRATEWHKMYVVRDGELVKIPLNEVLPGDRILVQSGATSEPADHASDDISYLAGVIAADGSIVEGVSSGGNTTRSARFALYGNKQELAGDIEARLARVLDGKGELALRQATLNPTFMVDEIRDRSVLNSAPFAKILYERGITKDSKADVPDFVKYGSRDEKISYLGGLFQLDACISGSLSNGSISIELGSTNRKALSDLQMILLDLGVYTRVYLANTAGSILMPNGKGGTDFYERSAYWTLRATSKSEALTLYELLSNYWTTTQVNGWKKFYKAPVKAMYRSHRHMATVAAIEFDGIEDVYDVTVDNGNSVIFNGIATGNCSEIAQYNSASEYNEDGSYSSVGNDISCNLGSMNIARTVESGMLAETVETAVRSLTEVSDVSDMRSVPSIRKGNNSSHSIGLGQMNLAGFLGKHEIFYGDDDALDFVNAYFGTVLYHALLTSSKIAEEKNERFEGFEGSDYAAQDGRYYGVFFDRYVSGEFDTRPTRQRIIDLFDQYGITAITSADWEGLARRVARTGIYNAYLQAIPPTGSISYINHSTSSIHPIVAKVEIRKEGQIGRVYYPAYGLSDENLDYYEDAYEVGYERLIDTYAAAQRHVDQALSLTTFMPDTITTRTLNKMYIYAWRRGIKTLYYVRFRQQALEGTAVNECVSCMV